ncbi:hypothetical protein Acr_00g0025470 [Actinidia rufa]|uniref:Retrovirus-related Pol polyprotein from transposon TNT 1-94-like beta-barrel domain-containing protein n=1 Tax=Actinidia rufa TaxID=165716 RepID=A0A7J0DE05_9ERIC|nr:hypothetical protein Acr_00g0025470 [Actinidia rufa]
MILFSATNYTIWKPRMEDILFCKNLHDPLENKGDKHVATKDEEWRKINRKTIELIRQCIGHEVFHHVAQETSVYKLWIKLEEIYQAKTSRNKALLMRRLMNLKFQRETTVAEHTSEFQNLSSDTAATAVMAVDEDEIDILLAALEDGKSDWVLDSGSAYHLCRDREVFSTYAPCEGRVWMANNTASRVVGRGSVQFYMADGRSVTLTEVRHVPNLRKNLISIGMLDSKGCSLDTSGGTLRVSKENKEMLWEKKTGVLYQLEGSVQIGGATVQHGSSGISKKSGQGKQPLHRDMQSKHRSTWRIRSGTRAQGDVLEYVRKSVQTRVMQPVQDVHREAQRKETKSILRSCTAKGAVMPNKSLSLLI